LNDPASLGSRPVVAVARSRPPRAHWASHGARGGGNFQDGSLPGKLQYGSAWWFLDQKDGMEAQLRALSNMGLLSRFVGMVTDSRSFLSYSRHEYFRRLLCNILGNDVAAGLIPDDRALLGRMVQDIAFFNARAYLGLELGSVGRGVEPAAA
jgi:glucuronate isomerase